MVEYIITYCLDLTIRVAVLLSFCYLGCKFANVGFEDDEEGDM